jgi:hypothetical protein
LAGFVTAACSPTATPTSQTGAPDLKSLSDEFDKPESLSNWKQIWQTEGWTANQLQKCSIENGNLVLMPYSSSWYQDYRGVLLYKEVTGDFIVTTKVTSTGRDGQSAPRSDYSLGGIMVRTPRQDNARSWRPGQENYIFLSIGTADRPGNFQFEVKTTENSVSTLEKTMAASGEALLQFVRVGRSVVLLKKQGGNWTVHKRYDRGDMPASLQVGFTVYTDWNSVSQMTPIQQNNTVIRGGRPDLISKFDYMRFARPAKTARPDQMSDSQLIQAFGDSVL